MSERVTAEANDAALNQMRLYGQNLQSVGESLEKVLNERVPANRAEKRRAGRVNKGGGGLVVDFDNGERSELVPARRAIKRVSGGRTR